MLQVELNDIPDTYHYKEVLVADINEVLKECEELNCFIIPVRLGLFPQCISITDHYQSHMHLESFKILENPPTRV